MLFFWIAAAILALAVLADGYTTETGVKSGKLVEADKLFVWLYGTNTPGPWHEYGVGALLVAAEITGYALLSKWVPDLKLVWPLMMLGQAAGHIYAAIKNNKLNKAYIK